MDLTSFFLLVYHTMENKIQTFRLNVAIINVVFETKFR